MANAKQQRLSKAEKKAAKEAAREAARKAERRRNRITGAVIAVLVLAGGGVIGFTLWQDAEEQAALEAELAAAEEEREQAAAEIEERIADRSVACGAQPPPGAGQEQEPFTERPRDEDFDNAELYEARLATSCGEIVLELHAFDAPETVENFIALAQDGFLDGREIFRNATSIEALQTGSGDDTAAWDAGYTIPDELRLANAGGYPVGSVAMANPGVPDAASTQFFFVYGDTFDEAFADNRTYTRFADVIEGLDVLETIGAIGTLGDDPSLPGAEVPAEVVYLESVTIEVVS